MSLGKISGLGRHVGPGVGQYSWSAGPVEHVVDDRTNPQANCVASSLWFVWGYCPIEKFGAKVSAQGGELLRKLPGAVAAQPDQDDGDISSIGLGNLQGYAVRCIHGYYWIALHTDSGATGVTVRWVGENQPLPALRRTAARARSIAQPRQLAQQWVAKPGARGPFGPLFVLPAKPSRRLARRARQARGRQASSTIRPLGPPQPRPLSDRLFHLSEATTQPQRRRGLPIPGASRRERRKAS